MDSVVEVRKCMWCHKPYYLSDGRYRYCSDECAEKARLARCEKKLIEPAETHQQSEWERRRDELWQLAMTACKSGNGNNIKRRRCKRKRTQLKNSKQRQKRQRRA